MTNDEILALDGKLACGNGGEGVVVDKLTIGDGFKQGVLEIRFSGKAAGTLINPNDPNDGSNDFPEPYECGEGIDLEATDKQKFYDKLNTFFNITPPLVDSEEEIFRFAPESENSVYDQIVGKRVYFRFACQPPANPKFPPKVFTNLARVRAREVISLDGLKQRLAASRAAKSAAEAKAKAQQDEMDKLLNGSAD